MQCKDCGYRYMPGTHRYESLHLCDGCFEARKRLNLARENEEITALEYSRAQKALARHNGKGRAFIESLLGDPR